MKLPIFLLALFSAALPAHAACNYMIRGLEQTMKRYRSYREENLANQKRLLEAAAHCKTDGETLSRRAQEMAKALSCEAQRDAHSLNAEMSSLGTRCQNSYQELQVLQARLQEHFLPAEADVRDAVGLIDHSPILQQNCGEEIQATRKMAEAFLQLEGNIAHVKENSVTGTKDYQQLAETGRALAAQTAALSRNCGSSGPMDATSLTAAGGSTHGVGSGIPRGRSPAQASDITGTEKPKDRITP